MKNKMIELKDYLKQFDSICWYPSAGYDLRPLLYLTRAWAERNGWKEDRFPDCFVLMNACGDDIGDAFLNNEGKCLHRDGRTEIMISDVRELTRLSLPKNPELAYHAETMARPYEEHDFYKHYGRVLVMDAHICSDRLGEWTTKLVYVIAENTAFAMDYLLENGIRIDYVYRAHYGYLPCSDSAGGRSTGHFILRILHQLGSRYFITEKDWDDIRMVDSAELVYENDLSGYGAAELSEVISIPAKYYYGNDYFRNDYFRQGFGFYRVESGEDTAPDVYVPELTKFKYIYALDADGGLDYSEPLSIPEFMRELMKYVCRLKNIQTMEDFMKLIPPDIMPFPVYISEEEMNDICDDSFKFQEKFQISLKEKGADFQIEYIIQCYSSNINFKDGFFFLRKQWKYLDFLKFLAKLQEIGVVAVPCC